MMPDIKMQASSIVYCPKHVQGNVYEEEERFFTMHTKLKMNLLKLGMSLLVVVSMATTFVGQHAFAAPPDCSNGGTVAVPAPGITITSPATSGTCALTLTATSTGGNLTFSTDSGSVTAGTYVPATYSSPFTFGSSLTDDRSGSGAWTLQASSTGLAGPGSSIIEPSFDSSTATGTAITGSGGSCATTTSAPAITLSGTPQTYLSAAASTPPVNCTYAISTSGTVNFVGHAAGTYTGIVTITLLNA